MKQKIGNVLEMLVISGAFWLCLPVVVKTFAAIGSMSGWAAVGFFGVGVGGIVVMAAMFAMMFFALGRKPKKEKAPTPSTSLKF